MRSITSLQPIEGEGGKLFPATYAEGKYANEKRRILDPNGAEQIVDCVLLDSVQSQANRAELALYDEIERGKIKFVLSGEKLRGMFTLVRTRNKGGDDSDPWLLIKDRGEGEFYERIAELYITIAQDLEALIDGWRHPGITAA